MTTDTPTDPAAELEKRIRLRFLTEATHDEVEPHTDGTDGYGDPIYIPLDETARIAAFEATATHDQDPARWGVVEAPDGR